MRGENDLDLGNSTKHQRELALNCALELQITEIDRLWSRTLVFWGLVGAIFISFGLLYDKHRDDPLPILIVSCFGFVASFAWTLQNRGSKYWQEAWERKLEILEADVIGFSLFGNREKLRDNGWWGANRASVSKLVVALSDLTVLVWMGIVAKIYLETHPIGDLPALDPRATALLPSLPTTILIATGLYAFVLWRRCRSKPSR